MLKLALKIIGSLAALALLAMVGLAIAFHFWMDGYAKELTAGSQIAHTPLGDVEYAIAGEGTPILALHGRPGGYDQTIAGPRSRPDDYAGLRTIAPSRPGYLRTPLEKQRTPAEQSDLFAALLDELGVRRAIIYGVSGGGASALQFAIRHPERTLGLILVAPQLVSDQKEAAEKTPPGPALYARDLAVWAGGQLALEQMAGVVITSFDAHDPEQVASARSMMKSLISTGRNAGNENDRAQYADLGVESWPLEAMSVPVLILHGDADENSSFEGSARAAARIPGAELVTFEGADHYMIFTKAPEIRERVRQFVGVASRR